MSDTIHRDMLAAVPALSRGRVGVVGDLVADLYVSGQSDRVSREAPVLILRYEKEWLRPGGAANVAANIAALGATVELVGIVGDDEGGRRLLSQLNASGTPGTIDCREVIIDAARATITKTRYLAGAKHTSRQQVLRLDREPLQPPSIELRRAVLDRVARLDSRVDAWVASDYGYRGFDDDLRALLARIAKHKPVIADSRFELIRFTGMTVIKPNEEEAEQAAHAMNLAPVDRQELAAGLALRLSAGSVLMTLGNAGMLLHESGRSVPIAPVGTEEIVDLTGAGDTVAATLAAGLAAGVNLEIACRLANHAAGIVVMKEGAATCSQEEIVRSISRPGL